MGPDRTTSVTRSEERPPTSTLRCFVALPETLRVPETLSETGHVPGIDVWTKGVPQGAEFRFSYRPIPVGMVQHCQAHGSQASHSRIFSRIRHNCG